MVIAIFGENCTGKSVLADFLSTNLGARIFTGKDYLRLAKNEGEARKIFKEMLEDRLVDGHLIYVISEKEHLDLVPQGAIRILVTADLTTIQNRFAKRMGGRLPAPVATMLERKHGIFDQEPHHIHYHSGPGTLQEIWSKVQGLLPQEEKTAP